MSAPPEPVSLLSGLDEAALYHDAGQHGFFALLWCDPDRERPGACGQAAEPPRRRKLTPKVQKSYRLSELPRVIEALDPERDTWISQAEFIRPNRRVVYLLRLNLCFVDLDVYKTPWRDRPPDVMAHLLRGFCADEDLPAPSLMLFSGRGLQVKWLLERPLPRAALPRWNAVQQHLVAALARFGADPAARDASRLLRLVDTVNTRSGERVRVLWVNDTQGEVRHYPFDYLAEGILPIDREMIRQARQAREQRRESLQLLQGGKTGGLRAFSGRQLAWDRLEDLRTLARRRGWTTAGIPHGYRSKYLHWCLNFLLLSGAVHSSQLFYEAQALTREVCPDLPQDVRSVLSTLYRKAQAYEAGEKVEFNGRQYPPLYTPRNSTLLELFEITDEEMKSLKTIITKEEAAERHNEREKERRRQSGAMDRAGYLETIKETAEQRRAQARLLRAKGYSWAEIGREMGISAEGARKLAAR